MQLDSTTLVIGGCFVAWLTGTLLVGARTQIAGAPALLWWAAADFATGAGVIIVVLHPIHGGLLEQMLGDGFLGVAPVLVWGGFRHFANRRQVALAPVACAAVLLAAIAAVPGHSRSIAAIIVFGATVAFLTASAIELWRERRETLSARWPLAGLLSANALVYAGGVLAAAKGNFTALNAPSPESWFGIIYFEGLVYLIGTAVFMLLLCKERSERQRILAARKDSLTGIANRTDFLDGAERLFQRAHSNGTSFSLIMFDLDQFKSVNDNFGHDVGDNVIRAFVDVARSMLRPSDLLGRYGGEEFVVALPKATLEAAYVIAERIRHAFSEVGLVVREHPLVTTVSGGVASAGEHTSISTMMRAADQAMYRAKRLGRNRIERMDDVTVVADDRGFVRVA
ncbi:MAG TPA: GGDEF domain-containing protein [Bauldia sp.]